MAELQPTNRPKTLTIVVPALNEVEKIAATFEEILPLAQEFLEDFEVVLVDDGSIDGTGAVMDSLRTRDPRVRVVHHAQTNGLASSFKNAVAQANFSSITVIPGDRAFRADGIRRVFAAVGTADMILSYRDNQSTRSWLRASLSFVLRTIINVLFGYRLRDVHSMVVYPATLLRQLKLEANGYAYQIEAIISLLKHGVSYVEVPVSLNEELRGSSRVMRPRTYLQLGFAILSLVLRTWTRQPSLEDQTQLSVLPE